MLKPISRLRSICKGDLNIISSYSNVIIHNRIGKKILHSIPVLSIFVLLGIMGFSTVGLPLAESDGKVYAAETVSNNTSLIIDNGTATDSTATVRNGVAYSSHTVQVKADNITGYSLTITGPSNLTNGNTTIGGAGGKTGTQLASADTGWGYGWNTTGTTNANIVYNSFPTTNNGTVTLESSNSVSSIDITRKLVFAAKFDQDATEGHYRANVTLNLTVTPKTVTTYNYSVTYYGNNNTSGSVPAKQTANSDDTPFILYAANQGNLARTDYTFLGWSESSTATSPTYTAGSIISLNVSSPTKNLYAVWEQTWNSLQYMQSMKPHFCNNATTGSSRTLIDSRDSKTYTVQKLVDGNCWMTQNMAIDLSIVTLKTADSDVSTTYAAGTASNNVSAWDADNTTTNNAKARFVVSSNSDYGGYYSWCAATAGTCKNSSGTVISSGDAPSSICPKGWRLPSKDDFQNLYDITSSAITSNTTPKHIIWAGANWSLAGNYYGGSSHDIGSYGYYWLRTANGGNYAYDLRVRDNEVYAVGTYFTRYIGVSVRCIAYSS